jgi:hypothetical protein
VRLFGLARICHSSPPGDSLRGQDVIGVVRVLDPRAAWHDDSREVAAEVFEEELAAELIGHRLDVPSG